MFLPLGSEHTNLGSLRFVVHMLKNRQVNFPPWRDARTACAERSRSGRVVFNPFF